MAVAATLVRPSFGNPISGWMNLKLDNQTGIVVGTTVLTVTAPVALYGGYNVTGVTKQLLPLGNIVLNVLSCSRPSGVLLFPKGSTVTG